MTPDESKAVNRLLDELVPPHNAKSGSINWGSKAEARAAIESLLVSAQDKVVDKAHTPCECGRDHFGTPVRSVMGNITTYCQFSRVEPSQLRHKEESVVITDEDAELLWGTKPGKEERKE